MPETEDELARENERLRGLVEELNRARQDAEQRANELAALNRVASSLTNVTDLRASLTLAARELTHVFNARGSTVTLIDEERENAAVVAEYFTDSSLPSVVGLPVPLDTPAWKRLDAERTAIVVEKPGEDLLLGDVRGVMKQRGVAQLLVAPLISRNQIIGNMSLSHEPGRSFQPNEVMLAQTLATPLAQAVENARLFHNAQKEINERRKTEQELARLLVTDALTGISNRRHFHEVLDEEWRRAQRAGESLSVLMIDVDFFKAYNDAYGHQAGDDALAAVANVLRNSLGRAGDFAGRYGGEEFVIILPRTDLEAARMIGERLRREVQELAVEHKKSGVASVVTASVGCAAMVPKMDTGPDILIAAADAAMYTAKRAGRNRVE
jgi:diguanylate cyclase (GGDEF)-like protein